MPKALLRDLRMDPNLEQLGGMGVSEIMETGSWNIKVPDHSGEAAGGARRIDGPSPTLHAYKAIIIPTSTEAQHHFRLFHTMLLQGRNRDFRQRNRPSALLGLRVC